MLIKEDPNDVLESKCSLRMSKHGEEPLFLLTHGLGSDLQGLMYQNPQRDLGLDLDEWDTRIMGSPTLVAAMLLVQ